MQQRRGRIKSFRQRRRGLHEHRVRTGFRRQWHGRLQHGDRRRGKVNRRGLYQHGGRLLRERPRRDSNNVALGWGRADGNSASNTAVGHAAQARGDNGRNVAVGARARALGGHSVALGDTAGANYNPITFDANGFDNAIAIGAAAFASTTASIAAGQKASVTGKYSVAVGAKSTATMKDSVAIGHKSVANAANTVSVGAKKRERRIVNVAKAVNGTDAVNLRQVKDLIKAAADQPASSAAATGTGNTALAIDELRQEVQALRELVELQKQQIDGLEGGRVAVAHAM